MKLIYLNTDITDDVNIRSADAYDRSGLSADSVIITLSDAKRFMAWNPLKNDTIRVEYENWNSGDMYLDAIAPDGDNITLYACAMKSDALNRRNACYKNIKLKDLIALCAAESGMEWGIYGADENLKYNCVIRRNEGAAAFASRMLMREGAVMKCVNGRMNGIDILYAQERKAVLNMDITEGQDGISLEDIWGWGFGSIRIVSPYGDATAYDTENKDGAHIIKTDMYPADNIEAARWARAMLLNHNRQGRVLEIKSAYNGSMTAMEKITVSGGGKADGDYLIDEVHHDLINKRTTARMVKAVNSIR